MSRTQERACRQRTLSQALRAFRQLYLSFQAVGLELCDSFPAEKRVLIASCGHEKLSRLVVLFDRFVGPVLSLLQESVARHALGSLLSRDGTQKPVVDSQRFGLVLRIDQQIKQHAVVHRRAIGLVDARVQIAQRLCRFLVLRRFVQHGEIRFDRVLDTILLKEALGAIQLLVDVCGHSFELPLRRLLFAEFVEPRAT